MNAIPDFSMDYSRGAHPAVLRDLTDLNNSGLEGYGCDQVTAEASKIILDRCGSPEGDVYFLVGGTQVNATMISALLSPCQGVLAADSSHIAVHEAGAVEATGHKILQLPHSRGKISARQIEDWMREFQLDANRDHTVQPGMVYLTHPTEFGTLYGKDELEEISLVCRSHGLKLYLDGARLVYALASAHNDLGLCDIARLCDAFYIGGTKVGALFGEAVVFPRNAPEHFFTHIKRSGALFAKGWVIAAGFRSLFAGELYKELGANAVDKGARLADILLEKGYPFYLQSPTNQQFVFVPTRCLPCLTSKVTVGVWAQYAPDVTIVRFSTDWATTDADLEALRSALPSFADLTRL